ncbi:nucleotidyltransferase [soil metagenome]
MNRAELVTKIKTQEQAIEAEGATALYVYGSRARDDQRPDSDLDVYVEYTPQSRFSLMSLAGIQVILTDTTGLQVSITTRDSLHPDIREAIESEAVKIF